MNRSTSNFDENAWYLWAGCTLVGLGIGIAVGSAWAGLIIGAGIGFLAMVGLTYINR